MWSTDREIPMTRRVIVLSDGTGNSAAKLAKTNVWRAYHALQLRDGTQLAKYDDGVGSSSIKVLALLGGAIGWGLKRNVLNLYKFICVNYEPGDDIFGFGFSRGAFTIRVLVELIDSQGLVRANSEELLKVWADDAYRRYRRECYRHTLFSPLGALYRVVTTSLRTWILGFARYDQSNNAQNIPIRFLGLWDTVDAYGMPIQELKKGIDKFIWPLSFKTHVLSSRVRKACHALALDDQRATFHPLLWDETAEDRASQRIEQVWFAGMHSNVGGGYPDDGMSYEPLIWILVNAQDAGLEVEPTLMAQYQAYASAFGRMYDSRANVSSYYRYSPRMISANPSPRIDNSVYQRIFGGGNQYAPISLPPQGHARQYHDLVWDTVWWRRVAYWVMTILSGTLVALPWLPLKWRRADAYTMDFVDALTGWLQVFIPKFAEGWLDGFAQKPGAFAALLAAILLTFGWGRLIEGRIRDRAQEIWHPNPDKRLEWLKQSKSRSRGLTAAAVLVLVSLLVVAIVRGSGWTWYGIWGIAIALAVAIGITRDRHATQRKVELGDSRAAAEPPGWGLKFARAMRTSRFTNWLWRAVSNQLFPTAFALAVAFFSLAVLNRAGFVALNLFNVVCTSPATAETISMGRSVVLDFETKMGCMPTGVRLEKGASYRIEFSRVTDWKDPPIEVANARGFDSGHPQAPWYMRVAVPFRRVVGASWFAPLAHIGSHGLTDRALKPVTTLEDVDRDGELFLAVNDAVIGVPFAWDYFYTRGAGANEGTAKVTIRKLTDARQHE